MNFRQYLESVESRYWRYRKKLERLFPGKDDAFYDDHMQKIIGIERQQGPVDDYNDMTFNKYVDRLMSQTGQSYPQGYRQERRYGSAFPTYNVGSQQTPPGEGQQGRKNVWVKNSADPHNYQRVLACQFASATLYSHEPGKAGQYYDKLYSGTRKGYDRPQDFWEIPRWIAVMANSLRNVDLYVIRDVNEAIEFFKKAKYKLIAFSVLDINKAKVEQIAQSYKGRIVVGGYTDLSDFKKYRNVRVINDMAAFVRSQKEEFQPGTDYRLFKGTEVIPRLCMSSGCKHNCKFCIVPNKLEQVPRDVIEQEAESLASLNARLVYLDDKTFGQAANYIILPEVYKQIKQRNPAFEGFIVQTTAAAMAFGNKLSAEFLRDAHIKYVELGIESYNDDILKKYNKPAREKTIDVAVDKIRKAGSALIPNIIVGFPEETEETYAHTLDWLKKNRDVISHVNVYNLAVYDDAAIAQSLKTDKDSDADENNPEKSFHTDPQLHKRFYDAIVDLGIELLDQKPGGQPQQAQPGVAAA